MSGAMVHDLTAADVGSGQWVRAVSRHTSGAKQTLYGPVTDVTCGMLLVADVYVAAIGDPDWTLVSCERVDPPRPAVPTGRNAIVQLEGGLTAWLTSYGWLDNEGDEVTHAHLASGITDVIWPGESE